jgi:alkanesulfonate monooxygenase SsuD/methylene tetrahydromethanopterin reductase-like flavin-dependent oxidoreductase (luciferase family)
MSVEIGIYAPQVSLPYEEVIDRARIAEELGFHSLWFYDHLYSPGLPALPSFEAWTLASYVLAQTTRLRVGHLVLCNNFRHPAVLAKMASTLDVLSGGRLELGIGSGSVQVEHEEAGLEWGSFAERSSRLGEALEILTRMFNGEPTSFEGDHYRVAGLPNLPAPLQRPRPPIHVGGVGPRRTLPLVARYADVWNVPTYGLAGWESSRRTLDEECARIGRDPASVRTAQEAVLVLAADQASLSEARAKAERRFGGPGWGLEAGGYVGTPAMVAERILERASRGVSLFVFFTHDRAHPRTLELLADQVVPRLS